MSRITIGDRVASAFVGAVVGAAIGLALAWLLGVYSNTLGPSTVTFGIPRFVLKVAATFALIGLLFGPSVGTILGNVITLLFAFESLDSQNVHLPRWLVALVLGLVAFGFWWFLSK